MFLKPGRMPLPSQDESLASRCSLPGGWTASSAMGYCKPHASLFLRALDELGVAAHEAVFVGDRMVDDVGGAQAVGMRTVLTHQYRREDPGRAPAAPDSVIGRLSELPAALERLEAEG